MKRRMGLFIALLAALLIVSAHADTAVTAELLTQPAYNSLLRYRVRMPSDGAFMDASLTLPNGLYAGLNPDQEEETTVIDGWAYGSLLVNNPYANGLEIHVYSGGMTALTLPLETLYLGESTAAPAEIDLPSEIFRAQPLPLTWSPVAGAEAYTVTLRYIDRNGWVDTPFSAYVRTTSCVIPADIMFEVTGTATVEVAAHIPGYDEVISTADFTVKNPVQITLTGVEAGGVYPINSLETWSVTATAPGANNVTLYVGQFWVPDIDNEAGDTEHYTYRAVLDMDGVWTITATAYYDSYVLVSDPVTFTYVNVGLISDLYYTFPPFLTTGEKLSIEMNAPEGHVLATEIIVLDGNAYPDGYPGELEGAPAEALNPLYVELIPTGSPLTLSQALPAGSYLLLIRPRLEPGWYWYGGSGGPLLVADLAAQADGLRLQLLEKPLASALVPFRVTLAEAAPFTVTWLTGEEEALLFESTAPLADWTGTFMPQSTGDTQTLRLTSGGRSVEVRFVPASHGALSAVDGLRISSLPPIVYDAPYTLAWTPVTGAVGYRVSLLRELGGYADPDWESPLLTAPTLTLPADFFTPYADREVSLMLTAYVPGYDPVSRVHSLRVPQGDPLAGTTITFTFTGIDPAADILVGTVESWSVAASAPGADDVSITVQPAGFTVNATLGDTETLTWTANSDPIDLVLTATAWYDTDTEPKELTSDPVTVHLVSLGEIRPALSMDSTTHEGQSPTVTVDCPQGHLAATDVLIYAANVDELTFLEELELPADQCAAARAQARLTDTGSFPLSVSLPAGEYRVVLKPIPETGYHCQTPFAIFYLAVTPAGLRGDADGNGLVQLADITEMLLALTAQENHLILKNADLDGDGLVTMQDTVLLLNMLCQ